MTDFEENLFLHAHIKELNELVKKLQKFVKKQTVEIGILKSEKDELRDLILTSKDKKYDTVKVLNQRNYIRHLEKKLEKIKNEKEFNR